MIAMPCSRAAASRLRDAVDGVVVGQREQLDARCGGARDHVDGRQRAVGVRRVGLQVESRRGIGIGSRREPSPEDPREGRGPR